MKKDFILQCGGKRFVKGERPLIMGIINVTPDSFSDGLAYFGAQKAIERGCELLAQGADVLDIGGVSTAPAALPVSQTEEGARIFSVISGLIKRGIDNICVDTSRAAIAEEALKLGAAWINDQSAGLDDEEMGWVMGKAQGVVLMHSRGGSGVQAGETVIYRDLLGEIDAFFEERIATLARCGVAYEKIIADPGIGFGKGLADSLKIIANMQRLGEVAAWSMLGLSRKSFLGKLTGIVEPKERDFATLGANLAGIMSGAHIVRTHNVSGMVSMLQAFYACRERDQDEDLHSGW